MPLCPHFDVELVEVYVTIRAGFSDTTCFDSYMIFSSMLYSKL
jgi:hypothetical protein